MVAKQTNKKNNIKKVKFHLCDAVFLNFLRAQHLKTWCMDVSKAFLFLYLPFVTC